VSIKNHDLNLRFFPHFRSPKVAEHWFSLQVMPQHEASLQRVSKCCVLLCTHGFGKFFFISVFVNFDFNYFISREGIKCYE